MGGQLPLNGFAGFSGLLCLTWALTTQRIPRNAIYVRAMKPDLSLEIQQVPVVFSGTLWISNWTVLLIFMVVTSLWHSVKAG